MRRRASSASCSAAKHSKMMELKESIQETFTPDPNQIEEFSARSYQTELMEQAKRENLIVCLPTGSGKTYIAVMLIKEMANAIRGSWKKGAKRSVFLVKTVQLASQQSSYLSTHLDLKIGTYYGDLGVDYWKLDKWEEELEKHNVLVFTAQVFLNLVDHNYFALKYVNLLIFDECQHATGENPYASLMNKHYDQCPDPPRILGLTASIIARKIKPKDLLEGARELEKIYRAQIAHRNESTKHGTSVNVENIPCESYQNDVMKRYDSLTIPFEFLRIMARLIQNNLNRKEYRMSELVSGLSQTMLTTNYRDENVERYHKQSSDLTSFVQLQSPVLPRLKRDLNNAIEIGQELGILGMTIFLQDLRKKLTTDEYRLCNMEQDAREVFNDIFQRVECLVDDILKNLCRLYSHHRHILFSPKVFKLLERIMQQQITKHTSGRCIVFVERVYTAAVLSEVVSDLISTFEPPWNTKLRVKHVTGFKTTFSEKSMTAHSQLATINEFRKGDINILIATAVVEEGLDIPTCDLVIRFNKPNNFSSYMQSKGRARAKQHASYVLFMDKSDAEGQQRDRNEYDNYEEIEKSIQKGFLLDSNDDSKYDLSEIPPYRPSDGIVIDAVRAAQLIMEYCLLLGGGQIFPPRFLLSGSAGAYTCILSMPANCPIRDDIVRINKTKRLAKYDCCLEMVKKLHQKHEFNEHCLPRKNHGASEIVPSYEQQIFHLVDELFEDKVDSSFETFPRKPIKFPVKSDLVSNDEWHLYKTNSDLAFVVPTPSLKLPKFQLYGYNGAIPIEIRHVKPINYTQYRTTLETFCRYVFENVFKDMNINSILKFDLADTPCKLLPCLLTSNDDIDWQRMEAICRRKNHPVKRFDELNESELYTTCHLEENTYYIYISDRSLLKKISDPYDKKNLEYVRTYADYFESKVPDVSIRRDSYLVTMKGFREPRINYLKETPTADESKKSSIPQYVYYPLELLRYAPLNRRDFEMIYQLPSLIVRILQLYRVERLRRLFADSIGTDKFIDANRQLPVTFRDYLMINQNQSLLPLARFTYHDLLSTKSNLQPSADILFQAITRSSANENCDMEGFEILGDCFLKLTVSMSLYHRYPLEGAGVLTVVKTKQISNKNLYRIAVMKKLTCYLNAKKLEFRGKNANWVPPGYVVNGSNINQNPTKFEFKRYEHQTVKRKAFADMMESFMGAFLLSTDYPTTIQFMLWLELDVVPFDKNKHLMSTPSIICSYINSNESKHVIEKFYTEQAFSSIENIIHYTFRDKAYLIAAFTHPSSFCNRLTSCYERLEFLGDAILDFLVTRHIFLTHKNIKPGQVTDIRQDLSNNGRLAYILVATGLHTKILHNSPALFGEMTVYADDNLLFPKDKPMEVLLSADINQWADSTAPKALADVFEALVGAIFLDSGYCLATVWQAIEPLLREYIRRSIEKPNLNPIRTVHEQGGKVVSEFALPGPTTKETVSVCYIEMKNGDQFIGRSVNKKKAKYEACQAAVNHLLSNVSTKD
ncbi:unnamed protein product [Adineta ricciae]|uniref:Uncharacterized protein n=1 Tax=Adineta ricciae TaxID=249248 RepID=A0A814UNY7_ADIRI|nr:unnamed protein product [Adineta ricciae]